MVYWKGFSIFRGMVFLAVLLLYWVTVEAGNALIYVCSTTGGEGQTKLWPINYLWAGINLCLPYLGYNIMETSEDKEIWQIAPFQIWENKSIVPINNGWLLQEFQQPQKGIKRMK